MAKDVKVENLSVIFGKPRQKEAALMLLDEDMTAEEIREKTGATVAVRNVNFEIEEGEMFVIVGLSGSGKSSFIRTLNLLNRPARGNILVGGESLLAMNKEELRAYRRNDTSMVFQHFGLLSHRTVFRNVEYPLEIQGVPEEERHERVMDAIKLVGLDGWENHAPRQLSGGMRQRVGLARALTNDPELLLMDEPYSALDPLIRREMQNQLLQLEDEMDRTIVFITHDMNEAFRMGDRIALMKDAEIVQIGPPSDFFEKPANEYVEKFIADVDKTRVLKVRSIMTKPKHVFKDSDDVQEALEYLKKASLEYCYVVDKNQKFLGYVTPEQLEKSKSKTLKTHIKNDDTAIYRNAYLHEAWTNLKDATYDLPVIDGRKRLRGVLSYDDVVEELAK
ncbi:MAG: glycine betaine/L-proline ABC transporter ATP-binding protein [Candidatus Izemoplasmataceae bacterium]